MAHSGLLTRVHMPAVLPSYGPRAVGLAGIPRWGALSGRNVAGQRTPGLSSGAAPASVLSRPGSDSSRTVARADVCATVS
jgi:hypothetical protein